MKKRILTILFILPAVFFAVSIQAECSAGRWDKPLSFLKNHFPPVYDKLGAINEMNGNRIVFSVSEGKAMPARGTELLITTNDSHPIYLQTPSALIKVVSVFGENVIAEKVMTVGREPQKGDNVVVPASPTIYLYTNIKKKETYPPYRDLVDGLLGQNLEIVELNKPEITDTPKRYGVLVRLEQSEGVLICKVQSIYSKDTLLSMTAGAEKKATVTGPAGKEVQLAKVQPEAASISREKPGVAMAEKPVFVKPGVPFHARTLSPEEREYYDLNDEGYTRFVITDVNGDGINEVCLLNEKGVYLFHFKGGRLDPVDQYVFKNSFIPVHLHSIDLNGDGGNELLVSLTEKTVFAGNADNELSSMVLTWKQGSLQVMDKDLPYYLRVIEDRNGHKVAIGQTEEAYDQYNGPIFKVVYDNQSSKVVRGGLYQPAADVYSIYQFNFDPVNTDQILILEPSNEVYGYYTPTEKVHATGPRKYGDYNETGYPKKLEMDLYNRGSFEKQGSKTVFTARRFVLKKDYDNQCFLINRERYKTTGIVDQNIKKILGRGTGGKDSIIGLSWRGERIVETWESSKIPRDIIDFSFVGQKGYILVRDDRGKYSIEVIR